MFYFILSICISSSISSAEQTWSLSRILQQASAQSPLLKASEQSLESAQRAADQAGTWNNPEVTYSKGSYKIDGEAGDSSTFTVMQEVPVFGQKRIAGKIGEQDRAVAEADRNLQNLLFQHEVVRLAFQLAAVNEQEKHDRHRRERLGLVDKYLKSRPFASPAQVIEKNLIQNRLRDIEERLVQITSIKEQAWQNLNIYMGLDQSITPQVIWTVKPRTIELKSLEQILPTVNPELIRQSRLVTKAELQTRQASRKAYPDLRLGAEIYDQNVSSSRERSVSGVVAITVPIWNRGGVATDAARAHAESEKYRLEHKRREVNAEFKMAWAHLVESQKRLELFPMSLIDQLEKQMNAAERNWKKGLVTAPAFLELENQVHEQATKVFEAQLDYVQAQSQLKLLLGQYYDLGGQ